MTDQERQPYELLLEHNVKVVNVGLEGFVKDLRDCSIDVIHVDWHCCPAQRLHSRKLSWGLGMVRDGGGGSSRWAIVRRPNR